MSFKSEGRRECVGTVPTFERDKCARSLSPFAFHMNFGPSTFQFSNVNDFVRCILLSSTCMHLPFIPTVAQLLSAQNNPRRMQFLSVSMESQNGKTTTKRNPNIYYNFHFCMAIRRLASLLRIKYHSFASELICMANALRRIYRTT